MLTNKLSHAVGLELAEVDLADLSDIATTKTAFDRYGAVLIRGLSLTPDALITFSRHFGQLDEAPVNEDGKTVVSGLPELYVVSNIKGADGKAIGSLGAGEAAWHTDMSYLPNPPDASMLYAVEVPATGGDTWVCSMAAALAEMPDSLRKRIEGRRIKHDGTYNSAGLLRQGAEATDDPHKAPGSWHPSICRHPRTGAEVLYLGRRRNAYVEGLGQEESDALLDDLWAHATQPQFAYTHRWAVGDLLMWDNRATLHRRDPFDVAARRLMHRTQIRGAKPPEAP
ncbi:MAG: TauD/TfdA dioxygenase family protein [Paracoccaceae bacterium]